MNPDTKREIQRRVECPLLTDEQVKIVTNICFREDDPLQKADCLFVFGSGTNFEEIANQIKHILELGVVKVVILTGGMPTYEDSNHDINKSESQLFLDAIDPLKYPDVRFILETKSHNTYQNVKFGVEEAQKADILLNNVIFLFKSQAAGRGYCTLREFLPEANLIQQSLLPPFYEKAIRKEDWYSDKEDRDKVWTEILRIRLYGDANRAEEKGRIDIYEIKDPLAELPIL